MSSQANKAKAFAALHVKKDGFILPNPWDVGSARILQHHGFKALATSSAAFANRIGRADYRISRDEALAHCREIAEATDLPVSADLERCFADRPEGVADTVKLATQTGIVGCSIEDLDETGKALYPIDIAVERVRLAVAAANRCGFPFLVTARTEALLIGIKDMDEITRRLKAFEKAGAHVVYATGVTSVDQARQIATSVKVPVNVMGLKMLSAPELFAAGVARVSVGPWFARAALQGLLDAIAEVTEKGTFTFAGKVPTGPEIAKMLG
jgi:2-methylisocitrate lyase-like PEP mutase family enzyme